MSLLVCVSFQNMIPNKKLSLHFFRLILVRNCEAHMSKLQSFLNDWCDINLPPGVWRRVIYVVFTYIHSDDDFGMFMPVYNETCGWSKICRMLIIKKKNKHKYVEFNTASFLKALKATDKAFMRGYFFLEPFLWCSSSTTEWLLLLFFFKYPWVLRHSIQL